MTQHDVRRDALAEEQMQQGELQSEVLQVSVDEGVSG